jgi:hypothetical protein
MWRSLSLLGNLRDWIASIGSEEVEDLLDLSRAPTNKLGADAK